MVVEVLAADRRPEGLTVNSHKFSGPEGEFVGALVKQGNDRVSIWIEGRDEDGPSVSATALPFDEAASLGLRLVRFMHAERDPESTRYVMQVIEHLVWALMKHDDAPASSDMHIEQATLTLLLGRLPTYQELSDWIRRPVESAVQPAPDGEP